MNIQELFKTNLDKLQNYQTIFQNQLTNLALFCQKLEELQFCYYEKSSDASTANLINELKLQTKNVLSLLIIAINVLNTNIKLISSVSLNLNTLPNEVIIYYLKGEEKVLTSCSLSCEKINQSLLVVASNIAKLQKQLTDNSELER